MPSLESHSGWKRRLKNWSDAEWLHQHEDTVLLVLTLIIGAVVGLVVPLSSTSLKVSPTRR